MNYKLLSIILIILIVLITAFFITLPYIQNYNLNLKAQGAEDTLNFIRQTVTDQGYITITLSNETIVCQKVG